MPSNPRLRTNAPVADHASKPQTPAPQPLLTESFQAVESVTAVPSALSVRKVAQLQRTIGNRNVARQIARSTTTAQRLPASPSPSPAVRRAEGDEEAGGGAAVLTAALSSISSAPSVEPEAVPGPETIQQALADGDNLGPELAAAKDNLPLAVEFQRSFQAEGGSEDAPRPLGGTAELAAYQAALPHQSNKSTNTGNSVKKAATIGSTVGKIGSTIAGGAVTVAHAGATVAQALGYVAQGIGAVLAIFDIRSAISSNKKGNELRLVMAGLKASNPQDAELIEAIAYSIEQKYSKAYTRAAKAISGLGASGIAIAALVAGVSLVALASNPVGWVIAAAIMGALALVGIGIVGYKLFRWIYKKWKGDLGVQRRKMAMQLYDRAVAADANATAALTALGLQPEKMKARAAEGELADRAAARKAGAGFKAVEAQHKRRTDKVKSSSDLVSLTRTRIALFRTEVLKWNQLAEKNAGGAIARNYRAKAAQAEAAILKEQKTLASQGTHLAERTRKLAQDDVASAWKAHSKIARGDIALIERKLKK